MKESTDNILTLSRVEMQKLALKRVAEISREFTEGFDFLADYSKSVNFFGANQFMEAANRGAFEAGGNSLGLLIKLPDGQITNKYITKSFASYYFFVRKVLLSFSAEAFIFFPGGFGTLDEFFEILTLVQTKKMVDIPIICVGSEYWNKLRKFMEEEQLSRGAIITEDLDLFHIVDDHDKIIEIIEKVPVHSGLPLTETN